MERWQTRILPSLPNPDRTDIVQRSLTRFPISRFRPQVLLISGSGSGPELRGEGSEGRGGEGRGRVMH